MASPLLPANRVFPELPPPLPEQVSATSLSRDDKHRLWSHLKQNQPEKAAFFDDPLVKELLALGATPAFDRKDVVAAGISLT